MISGRRKKWTEAEERSLIEKYGEMVSDGSLSKMKTREKKFKPIASYVNSVHHVQDPIAFPWQWSWKDVSTKVQNMRHQYLLVKQKIKKQATNQADSGGAGDGPEEFDWAEGSTHWSNFSRYKAVFGDLGGAATTSNAGELMAATTSGFGGGDLGLEIAEFGAMGHSGEAEFGAGIDGMENGVMGLGFEYDAQEGEGNYNGNGDDGFVYEEVEQSGKRRRKRRESEEREREEEREWEERMNRRRSEWRKRMEKMMSRHREEMGQMQSRILQEQQNLTNQLVGMVSQWTTHPPDHTTATHHYFNTPVQGENQDHHFIVHG